MKTETDRKGKIMQTRLGATHKILQKTLKIPFKFNYGNWMTSYL